MLPGLLFLFATEPRSDSKINFSDANQRLSYSLGSLIGDTIKQKNIALSETALIKGMQDGQEQISPLLDSVTLENLSTESKNRLYHYMGLDSQNPIKSRREIYANRKLTGRSFILANQHRQGVVSLPSGLQYKVIHSGKGESPQAYDTVGIEFHIHSLDGKQIANSGSKGETTVFPVKSLIKGLAEAVQLMKPGASWEVYIPPHLAYGRMRRFANMTVIADVRLESVY